MVLNDLYVKWQEEAPLGLISPDGNQVKLNNPQGYAQELEVIYYTSNGHQIACTCLEGQYYYQATEQEWVIYDEIPFPDFDRYTFDFSHEDVFQKMKRTYV